MADSNLDAAVAAMFTPTDTTDTQNEGGGVAPSARGPADDSRGSSRDESSADRDNRKTRDEIDEEEVVTDGDDADRQTAQDVKQSDDDDAQEEGGAERQSDDEDDDEFDILTDDFEDEDGDDDDDDSIKRLGDDDDDALVTVTVDGEETEVSLADLKRRYAGEGAIDRRVQEATESRNKAIQDFDRTQQVLTAVMENLGGLLFRRVVQAPDPALRGSDPAAYLQQMELYNQEEQALGAAFQQLQGMMNQADSVKAEVTQDVKDAAAKEVRRRIPSLADPKRAPQVKNHIVNAALNAGFTKEQISACTDPNLFVLAYWAARGEAAAKRGKVTLEKGANPKPKLKGKSSANRTTTPQQRQRKQAVAKARKTGSVDDVALTILQPQRRTF